MIEDGVSALHIFHHWLSHVKVLWHIM